MITLADLVIRFPGMANMTQPNFDMKVQDAVLIMGVDETRWLGWYNPAMAALIAHLSTLFDDLAPGAAALSALPVVRTDVDDVQVEFGERMVTDIPYIEASWYSSVYGQQYVMWRRMAFAGPRIA